MYSSVITDHELMVYMCMQAQPGRSRAAQGSIWGRGWEVGCV